ncbi:MAG: DnaJ domain-containing protein [Verrucomicrobiota bacterium]|nr:DnaJ domain-containing protein [Verrucomicrobiota bacterium]
MTDYFALLNQPRAAWLDPEQLREAFHAQTRQAHPDASGDDAAFAEVNQAYQVLREPKRRIQHLLALLGDLPAQQSAAIPPDIAELFPGVAALTRKADVVLEQSRSATSSLSRSLVRPELVRTREEVEQLRSELQAMVDRADEQLQSADHVSELRELYLRFSYLARWLSELEEKLLQLSA